MIHQDITYKIRGAIFSVFAELGPGLFESVYEKALTYELRSSGLQVASQVPVHAVYKGIDMDLGFRIDLLVDDHVLVEIKSVAQLQDVHKKQVLTYLRLTGIQVGLLVNFNCSFIQDNKSFFRIVN